MIENDDLLVVHSYSNESTNHPQHNNNGGGNSEHNINVVIRVRPIITPPRSSNLNNNNANNKSSVEDQSRQQHDGSSSASSDADQSTAITFPAAGQIQVEDTIANVSRTFAFNVVFEPEATQEEVFEHSGVKRLIDMALDGFACTIFAYGQTSTGKTYTLTGNVNQYARQNSSSSSSVSVSSSHHHNGSSGGGSNSSNKNRQHLKRNNNNNNKMNHNHNNNEQQQPHHIENNSTSTTTTVKNIGIVQLSFAYLFEQIKRRKLRDKILYVITVSYLEVYNEQVLDLLNPSPRSLNVRWAKDRGFYAENLFKVECEDLGDLEGVLEEGCKNRQVRSHSMNENSSRSHSVMTITLSSEISDPEDPQGFIRKEGRLCLVDLAGSEKTKRTNSKGGTFVEANNINRSLLVLGNCIACLADHKRRNGHIPYRDSTLTKLLADSLSGNGMTLMIACVSPMKCDAQETISTLRYASRAKRVRMNPVVQMDPRELLILSLKREIRMLKIENNYLRQNYHQIWAANSLQDNSNVLQQMTNAGLILDNNHHQQPSTTINNIKSKDQENLLDKYMKENEVLRVENVQVNLQRNRLVRDHELVCRENEQLLRKLNLLLYKLNSVEARQQQQRRQYFGHSSSILLPPQPLPPLSSSGLFSSASSPSILSSLAAYDEQERHQLQPQQEAPVVRDSLVRAENNTLLRDMESQVSSMEQGPPNRTMTTTMRMMMNDTHNDPSPSLLDHHHPHNYNYTNSIGSNSTSYHRVMENDNNTNNYTNNNSDITKRKNSNNNNEQQLSKPSTTMMITTRSNQNQVTASQQHNNRYQISSNHNNNNNQTEINSDLDLTVRGKSAAVNNKMNYHSNSSSSKGSSSHNKANR